MPLHALLIAHGFRNMLLDPVHVVPGQACQRQFHLSAFLQFKGNFPAGGAEADKSRRDGFAGGIGPHARLMRHIGLLRRGKRQQHGREGRKQSGSHSPGNRLPTFGSQEDSSDCTTLDTSLFGRLHSCRSGTEHPNCHHNRKQIFLFVFEPFFTALIPGGRQQNKRGTGKHHTSFTINEIFFLLRNMSLLEAFWNSFPVPVLKTLSWQRPSDNNRKHLILNHFHPHLHQTFPCHPTERPGTRII